MTDRNCALESAAYGELKKSFENRWEYIRNLIKDGGKAVWMAGDDVPEEIIMAGGMIPVRLPGFSGSRPNADKYLEISFGDYWRGLFESIMNGENSDIMDYLAFSNSSDLIHKLYHYLVQIRKIEPERKLPDFHFIDYWLVERDFRSQERNLRETGDFLKTVESWSGREITESDLVRAIELCNDHKAALKQFSALRRGEECRITGSEALTVITGSFYMDRKTAADLIRQVTEDAENWPRVEAVRCLYTGSAQENADVYRLMENCGLNMVTEDHVMGDRYADCETDASLPPLRAVSARYHNRPASSERGTVKERSVYIPRLAAEAGAEAVVVFMNHNDESYIWDLPKQKLELDKAGIRILTVEDQYCPLKEQDKLMETLTDFAVSLKEGVNRG